jgi:uncharacterized protein
MDHSHEERGFFAGITRITLRFPFLTLGFVFLGVLAMMFQIATRGLTIDNSPEVFEAVGSRTSVVLSELREEFGQDQLFVVVVEGDVFTRPFLEKLDSLHNGLAAIDIDFDYLQGFGSEEGGEGSPDLIDGFDDDGWGDEEGGTIIDEVISLAGVRDTRATTDGVSVGDLRDSWPVSGPLDSFRERVLSERTYRNRLVSAEGRHALVIVRAQVVTEQSLVALYNAILDETQKHVEKGFVTKTGGGAAMNARINELTIIDMGLAFILASILMFGALLAIYRHPIGVVAPLAIISIANIFTLGLMSILGMSLNYLNSIVPVFLTCVGVADAIHVQSLYRDLRRSGCENASAIIRSMQAAGVPIFFTSLTTMVGLISFRTASLKPIIQLGTLGAFGVLIAFIATTLVLPPVLSMNKRSLLGASEGGGKDWLDRFLRRCSGFSGGIYAASQDPIFQKRARHKALWLGLLIGVGALLFTSQVRVNHDQLAWFPESEELHQAFDLIDNNVGGVAQFLLLIEMKEGKKIQDIETLKALVQLEEHILSFVDPNSGEKIVKKSTSILDIIRETNRALHGGSQEYYRMPDSTAQATDILFLFENSAPDDLMRLATSDLNKTQMQFTLRWLPATSYQPLSKHIDAGIEKYVSEVAVVKPTGFLYSVLSAFGALIPDLLKSFGLAFVIITVLLAILLRDLKLGLVAMFPNLLPVLMTVGLMGILDIPIDGSTLLIASVALGLCVDDTIHFVHHFQHHYKLSGRVEEAIEATTRDSGRAIVSTSVVLILSIAPCLIATLYSLVWFGLLIIAAIAFAVFADLVLTPAIFRSLYKDRV